MCLLDPDECLKTGLDDTHVFKNVSCIC